MLKKYVQYIVKSELEQQKLNNIFSLTRLYNLNTANHEERQQFEKQISHLKDQIDSSNERKKYLKLQIFQLKQENQELKESLEKQKQRQYETNEFWSQQKIADESEKLKQENIHLNKRLDEYSKTLLESIKIKDFLQEENENLKKENKELLDSKNGLNGVNEFCLQQKNQ